MGLDRSKQLAVDALTDKLKAMIEQRICKSNSYGGAQSSWSVQEQFYTSDKWTGSPWTPADEEQRDRILASYKAELARMKAAEEEVWQAIADLLKN